MSLLFWLESKRVLSVFLLLLISAMLYVGLKDDVPKTNQVTLSEADGALVFGERALAYSKQRMSDDWVSYLNKSGYEIDIEFSPLSYDKQLFQFLLLFSNGDPAEQLIVSQVRDYIIVMNGDDYNYRQKLPRLTAKITDPFQGFQRLKIVASEQSTVLSINDKKLLVKPSGMLKIPEGKAGVRLLLSGSELLENNWRGAIKSLSIKPLVKRADRADHWSFKAKQNTGLKELTKNWLIIPDQVILLSHQVFINESFKIHSNNDIKDIVLNFLGFIPFGYVLALLVLKAPMRFTHQFSRAAFVLFAVFLCGFLLSFVIEYRQVWLVTRQSSLRDLYLNSVGAVCGAVMSLLCLYVSRHIKRGEVKN
jgi:glycopeptide antibiotics resistance protein